jgi:hypothetical protein
MIFFNAKNYAYESTKQGCRWSIAPSEEEDRGKNYPLRI